VLAWRFQLASGKLAREVDELISPEHLAEIDALMASDAHRRADAWPAAR